MRLLADTHVVLWALFDPAALSASAARALAPHHRDPFDRMLVAQAIAEGLTLVTRDARLSAYGARLLAA